MSISRLESIGLNAPTTNATRDDATLRRAATEFEALLLKQLTASLNPSEDDEDSLFGNSNGSGMYQQMFSEHLAMAMARSGGVGLAETILRQVRSLANPPANNAATRAVEIARSVRNESAVPTEPLKPSTAQSPTLAAHPAQRPAHPAAAPPAAIFSGPVPERAAGPRTPAAAEKPLMPERERLTPTGPSPARGVASAPTTTSAAAAPVPLRLPVSGRVSSNFGTRRDPLQGGQRQHGGVDIAAPRGTPIAAAATGKVVFAGRRGGYGNLVEVEHADGRRTRYAHAEHLLVKPGDEVQRGQTIATVGSTGRSTGPHLHFEVRDQAGAKVNPLAAVIKDSSSKRR